MTWNIFPWIAVPTMLCWGIAAFLALRTNHISLSKKIGGAGLLLLAFFIAALWLALERPPLRTMGETRLWYAFFIVAAGLGTSIRWQYPWLFGICCLLGCIFICTNLLKPEMHSITLMPALQSYWFIPHVTVYILSYALLGVATVAALRQQYLLLRKKEHDAPLQIFIDNIVYVGCGFLLLGLLSGAFWAKEAWGHYWSWDPKETWAFITATGYIIYIHMRARGALSACAISVLPFAFLLLMITWLGISFLPTGAASVHVYS